MIDGSLAVPTSKSLTNRALTIGLLASGRRSIVDPLRSDDTIAMSEAVAALGAGVTDRDGAWEVEGTSGHPVARSDLPRSRSYGAPPQSRSSGATIDARSSGTTLRFATAAATLAEGSRVTITGRPDLARRPVGPLVEALRAMGAVVRDHAGLLPVSVEGGRLHGGDIEVDATTSSQHASALLLVSPFAAGTSRIRIRGAGAGGYVDLTLDMMAEAGIRWTRPAHETDDDVVEVEGGQTYAAGTTRIEHDASAAAHLFAFAVGSGGTVAVTNARASRQPDAGLLDVFGSLGARVGRTDAGIDVTGPGSVPAFEVDLRSMPDQLPTMAVLAALADGRSRIGGVRVARGHETDRIAALAAELGSIGVRVEELDDGLTVEGGGLPATEASVSSRGDHRLAMALSILAVAVPVVRVDLAESVEKTYPAFWDDLRSLGFDVAPG